MWTQIAIQIAHVTGKPFCADVQQSVGGGCINATFMIADHHRAERYFVKYNAVQRVDMFEAEYAGLQALRQTRTIRVPEPVCVGVAGGKAFLAMEYLSFKDGNAQSASQLGERLAALHRYTEPHFGWYRDNTIGTTPQLNDATDNWLEFFAERRLRFQLHLAAQNGYAGLLDSGERLISRLADLFPGYQPTASLLHGDLWSGNHAYLGDGTPVLFDPAVYFGDRETDLAMTELFGGFPPAFYDAYNASFALDAGYATRKTLYNLYHILNHLNLFGGGYYDQARRMIEQLLSELK